jgi:hypothetical protein
MAVKNDIKKKIENILYSIKCIEEVAMERRNIEVYYACEELRNALRIINMLSPISSKKLLKEIRFTADKISSDLLSAVKFEMHEVLVPFIEVKKTTHGFGIQTFPDYFRWLSPEKQYTPELLVGILEEQEQKLSIARNHLEKV